MEILFPALIFIFWCCGTFLLWHIPFPKSGKGKRVSANELTVIIPARNEEKRLPILLKSLGEQEDHPLEVIVVDDHSDDNTSEVARRYDALVVTSEMLPDGWLGKPWACWQGTKVAKGVYFLFLDADTVLEKNGISKILEILESKKGLVSIQPYHYMERLYEQLSAVFNIITMVGTSAFIFLRGSLTPSGAFGPCIALSRDDYSAVGGHAAVRNSVLENLALGRLFARQGRIINCYGGKGTIRFRMYADGFKSLFEGFSKGFATGANIISPLVLTLSIAWIVGSISVFRHLVQALVLVQTAEIFLWLVFYLLFSAQIYWMLFRIGNFRIMTAIFYPIPLLFFVVVFIWSMVLTFVLRRANWKQRKISIDSTGKTS